MLLLLTPRWWKVGLKPGRRPSTGRIVRWRLQLRPALHPRVTAHIPLLRRTKAAVACRH